MKNLVNKTPLKDTNIAVIIDHKKCGGGEDEMEIYELSGIQVRIILLK